MNLYIPVLGEQLKLTEDWTINVQWENRNLSLIKEYDKTLINKYNELKKEFERCFNLTWQDGFKAIGKIDEFNVDKLSNNGKLFLIPQQAKNWIDLQRENAYKKLKDLKEKNAITFKFKKGTVLEIDRIYIRKGSPTFSSITFKWRKDKKVIRFWANIEEVNKIQFEKSGKNGWDEKWPNGRFCLHIFSNYTELGVEKSETGKSTIISSKTKKNLMESGNPSWAEKQKYIDNFLVENYFNNKFGYVKYFDSVEKLVDFSQKKGINEFQVKAFLKAIKK